MLARHRVSLVPIMGAALVAATFASLLNTGAAIAAPRYYFRVVEVLGAVDDNVRDKARELLLKELTARDLFTPELGGAQVSEAVLKEKGLRGLDVSLRFENLTKELKEPRAGRRLKQLVVGMRVSVFGSDMVDHKLVFSGDGESMQIVEVDERRLDKETSALLTEVLADAIAQAVDQAVLKLSLPQTHASPKTKKKSGKAK